MQITKLSKKTREKYLYTIDKILSMLNSVAKTKLVLKIIIAVLDIDGKLSYEKLQFSQYVTL